MIEIIAKVRSGYRYGNSKEAETDEDTWLRPFRKGHLRLVSKDRDRTVMLKEGGNHRVAGEVWC